MTIVNLRSCNMSESTFIWKLQNHAFVRSISDGLSAVREIADIAYSAGETCFTTTSAQSIIAEDYGRERECKTINIGAGRGYDIASMLSVSRNMR